MYVCHVHVSVLWACNGEEGCCSGMAGHQESGLLLPFVAIYADTLTWLTVRSGRSWSGLSRGTLTECDACWRDCAAGTREGFWGWRLMPMGCWQEWGNQEGRLHMFQPHRD